MSSHKIETIYVFWNIEACPIPADVDAEDVNSNIKKFLNRNFQEDKNIKIEWEAKISVYGDMKALEEKEKRKKKSKISLSTLLIRCGVENVNTIDSGREFQAALFKHDFMRSSSPFIMVITNDPELSESFQLLKQWGHKIIYVIPSGVGVSQELRKHVIRVWEWHDVVSAGERGETSSSH